MTDKELQLTIDRDDWKAKYNNLLDTITRLEKELDESRQREEVAKKVINELRNERINNSAAKYYRRKYITKQAELENVCQELIKEREKNENR